MYLEKKINLKTGFNKKFTIKSELNFFKKFKKLTFRPNNRRGLTIKQQKNLRSIKPIKINSTIVKIYYFNNIKLLKFLLNFIINPINNKITSLFCCSNGIFFYSISTAKEKLWRFYTFFKIKLIKKFKLKKNWTFLFNLKKRTKICLFSYTNTYINCARSLGAFAKINQVNKKLNVAYVILPSKKKIILPLFTIVSKSFVRKLSRKKLVCTYAGFNVLRGKKANTRGTAMNPIDHPHGGRTNSIKLHKTPWAYPTKKK